MESHSNLSTPIVSVEDSIANTIISSNTAKVSKRGRLPGKTCLNVVEYNNALYAIITIQHKKSDVKFVIDYSNLSKIKNMTWHMSSGRYIATNYILKDGSVKELYLHNFLKDKIQDIDNSEKEYVIHINSNILDNRNENLRIVNSDTYYHSKSKRKRNIVLPDNCGFIADDIPKYISYVKANGEHGDRFTIEIPKLNLFKKLTSSKKISLKDKLNEAIKYLKNIYENHPEVDPNKEIILKNSLSESFTKILNSNNI